jgi:hypothetical protein
MYFSFFMKGNIKPANRKWKCLVCGATGKYFLTSWKANRSARQHINLKHNRIGNVIIFKEKSLVRS